MTNPVFEGQHHYRWYRLSTCVHSYPYQQADECLCIWKGWEESSSRCCHKCEMKLCTQAFIGFLVLFLGDQREAGFLSPLEVWGEQVSLNISVLQDCAFCSSVELISPGSRA